jgi:hypothetical protein
MALPGPSKRLHAAAVVTAMTAAALGGLALPAQADTTTAAENDMNGDGYADLVVVGNQGSLAPGLWLTNGTADGGLGGTATDIGVNGLASSVASPGPPTTARLPPAAAARPRRGRWRAARSVLGHSAEVGGVSGIRRGRPCQCRS